MADVARRVHGGGFSAISEHWRFRVNYGYGVEDFSEAQQLFNTGAVLDMSAARALGTDRSGA